MKIWPAPCIPIVEPPSMIAAVAVRVEKGFAVVFVEPQRGHPYPAGVVFVEQQRRWP